MKISSFFKRCLSAPYTHVENGGDFFLAREGGILTVYLQHSQGAEDWKNNLDFPARGYARACGSPLLAHRGFLRVWESVAPHLTGALTDAATCRIRIVGYSHGAALALFCYDLALCLRPTLADGVTALAFGAPRVLWGVRTGTLRARFSRFFRIANEDDLVTRLPPAALGYFHVGTSVPLAKRGTYSLTDAHRPENILTELRRMESQKSLDLDKIL